MAGFDEAVILLFNRLARASWTFDSTVSFLSTSNLLKSGVLAAVLWWLWFREDVESNRGHIIATLVASIVAIVAGRGLALTLPHRVRPLHDPAVPLVTPYGLPETRLEGWSAMPSDHAVLFIALATGVWFISRRIGALVTAYVVVVILLPRIYLGLHYPSDLLVGAAVGASIAAVANAAPVRRPLANAGLHWMRTAPGTFYACLFLLCYQLAVMFTDGRDIASFVYRILSARL